MCVIRDIDLGYVLPWIIYIIYIYISDIYSLVSYANIGAAGVRESIGYLYQVGIGERFDYQHQ